MAQIPVRPLGSQGLQASAQGLGCMGMSWAYSDPKNPPKDADSVAVIHAARELGITFLDTADVYGPHTNEVLVGKAIAGDRQGYTLATKFANIMSDKGWEVRGDAAYVRAAVEASLERLGVDKIDLYYQHRVDRTVPIEETWGELKKLVEEGKVGYLGISEASAEEIRRAHAVHPITACQLEWSLWTRNAEEEVIPTLRELGIGIVAYSPLGRGMLTGAITSAADIPEGDSRASRMPRFMGDALTANLLLVEKVKEIAQRRGCTPGQLALAWVHAQGDDVFPIPGTKKLKYLKENAAAFSVKLSPEEKAELEDIFHADKVTGDRYGAAHLKFGLEGAQKAKA